MECMSPAASALHALLPVRQNLGPIGPFAGSYLAGQHSCRGIELQCMSYRLSIVSSTIARCLSLGHRPWLDHRDQNKSHSLHRHSVPEIISSSIHQFAYSGALHAEDQSGNPIQFPSHRHPAIPDRDWSGRRHCRGNYGNDYIEFNLEAELTGTYDGENFKFTTPSQGGAIWGIRVDGEPWHIRKIHMHDHVEHVVTGASDQHFECHLLHSRPDDEDAASDKLVMGSYSS